MSPKKARKSLDAFLVEAETPPPAEPEERLQETKVEKKGKGTVQISGYLPPGAYEQLRVLAFHERKKMNALLLEGIDLLFAKRGEKSLAELERES